MPERRRPTLSAEWKRFVRRYGVDLAYWYQPKGLAITSNSVHKRLAILKEFSNTLPWRECQAAYVVRLKEEGISAAEDEWVDGGAPLARMLKQVMTVLGLAWIDPGERVELTRAGEEFLSSSDPNQVLSQQALRYQFWNPSVSSKTHMVVKLHPVPFLIRLMQAVNGNVTDAEYTLFVAKARKIGDVDVVASEIDRFRELSNEEQVELIRQCNGYAIAGTRRTSILNTIRLNRAYAYRMWTLSTMIETDPAGGLRLRNNSVRGEARKYLDVYASSGTYIEFVNEKEFLSWMGDPSQLPTEAAALDVYVNRGDLLSAALVKKRMGATTTEIRTFKRMMIDEKTLETNIENNLGEFGRRLNLDLLLVGRQYSTTVGPIDLLARDKHSGSYVVVELKRGRSADKVFGQLSRYMGWVKRVLADGKPVIGVIVASKIDDKLRSARDAHDSDVRLVEYESKISVSVV